MARQRRRPDKHAQIIIAEAPEGAWLMFTGMARPPIPAIRWVHTLDHARAFAITFHECHGWPISEAYCGDPRETE